MCKSSIQSAGLAGTEVNYSYFIVYAGKPTCTRNYADSAEFEQMDRPLSGIPQPIWPFTRGGVSAIRATHTATVL